MSARRYLVTGNRGFIGRWVERHLHEHTPGSDRILGVNRQGRVPVELTDASVIRQILACWHPTHVLHLAGRTAGSYLDLAAANVSTTLTLLSAVAGMTKPARVLIASSSSVYGEVPAAECPITEDRPTNPWGNYGRSKVCQEDLARAYADKVGLDIVIARIFNVCGPGQPDHLVPAVFATRPFDLPSGEALRIRNPQAVRDWLDVRDVAAALCLLVHKGEPGGIYNVGDGTLANNLLIMQMVLAAAKDCRRVDSAECLGDSNLWSRASAMKLRAFGWRPSYSLEQSIAETRDWNSRGV